MKHLISSLLAIILACTMLCGGAFAESGINFDEPPYTINFPLITLGDSPADLMLVENTLNDYLLQKINAQVELEAISIANITNTFTMRAASHEKTDIISLLPAYTQLLPMVSSNMLLDITDLMESYGQGIIADAGEILEAGKLNGRQYFLPAYEDYYTAGGGLSFNSELVKKYDLVDKIQAITTLADLEPLLALIKENEPNVTPFTSELAQAYQAFLFGYDGLGNELGVIDLNKGDDLNVVNWYASDTFRERCELLHSWFEKGYISQDAATAQDGGNTLVPAGAAFCCISSFAPNQDEGFDLDKAMVEIQLPDVQPLLTTNSFQATGHCIAASCERPDKVMQFLNLLYTDEYVCTLLMRGIENMHYTVDENGLIAGTSMDSGYYIIFGQFGDQKLEGVLASNGVDYREKVSEFSKGCKLSPAFGFVFDSTPVQTQVAACTAVVDQYYVVISTGSQNPADAIPEFLNKLEQAGINEIIAEKQRQLDAWAALK